LGPSFNAVGSGLFDPHSTVGATNVQGGNRSDSSPKEASDFASQQETSPESQSAPDTGFVYQVSDAVALQLQLQTVFGANTPLSPAAGGGADAATDQTASNTAPAGNPTQTSTINAVDNPAASGVQSEENQLITTLQSLGLSPSSIQEFTSIGDLLAEMSPALFQAFLNAMPEIAQAVGGNGLSDSVSIAGAATAISTFASASSGQSDTASAPAGANATGALTSDTSPASQLQVDVASVEVSEVEVQLTSASSGQSDTASAPAGSDATGTSTSDSSPASQLQVDLASLEISEVEVQLTSASSRQSDATSAASPSST
jgi:hypothetical protein